MNIKAIVTDLDGTLLRSDKTISERTLEALAKCRDLGIIIGAATARSEASAQRYLDLFKPDIIISNGGALAKCFGEIVYKSMLDPETVSGIIKLCQKFQPNGDITVETDEGYFWNYKEKPPTGSDFDYSIYSDFSDFARPAYKITAILENQDDMYKIAGKFPSCSCLAFTGEVWRRFANKDAGKVSAIRKISERLGIPTGSIAAFGDDYNDVEMLKYCGIGVAMGNSVDDAKRSADFICGTNDDDGLAEFIEENILRGNFNA